MHDCNQLRKEMAEKGKRTKRGRFVVANAANGRWNYFEKKGGRRTSSIECHVLKRSFSQLETESYPRHFSLIIQRVKCLLFKCSKNLI